MARHKSSPSDSLQVYDFDHTIYKGDCSVDFYLFCLIRKPLLARYMPYQLWHLLKYILRLEDKTALKSNYFVFLRGLDDVNAWAERFWDANYKRIKSWYRATDHSRDVIISASPELLLKPVASRLKIHKLIATEMDSETGRIIGSNCRGQEKARRLHKAFPGVTIDSVYSDSLSDLPILSLARNKYIIKGNDKITLDEYQNTSSLKKAYLTIIGRL